MEKYDRLELIQKYFRDELSPEERQAFHRLEQDPDFLEEMAEFEFFHDLLEAGTLMEEEEAMMGKAASGSSLNEPRFSAADQGSASKHLKEIKDDEKHAVQPTSGHKPPTLQLRRSRVIRYAIAASVLLLLAVGVTFYWNNRPDAQQKTTDIAPLTTNGPLIAIISYKEVSDHPVRDLQIPDTTFTVKIYPPGDGYNFHYLFRISDTLRLYGKFNPKDLELQYNESRMEYQLMYKDNSYLLERNKEITPLTPVEK